MAASSQVPRLTWAERARLHKTGRLLLGAWLLILSCASLAPAAGLDEMALPRWEKLREVERYQLQVAEKYFREKNWKVAAAEYDKYLTLYEQSEAASYALLKWSLAQVQLRRHNTAIKEGLQSVIDYWPESEDAVAAAYYIGNTYKGMGQLDRAKKAYRQVLGEHPKHLATAYSLSDLIEIAAVEKDDKARVELWKKLVFEVERTKPTQNLCADASRQLAVHLFYQGAFPDGVASLETTYDETSLPAQVVAHVRTPISRLCSAEESKSKGENLADQAVAYVRRLIPTGTEDAERQQARELSFAVADLQAMAGRDREVLQAYEQMLKDFGAADDVLARMAEWHKAQKRFAEARQTYARYQDKAEGLNQVAYSYRQEADYDAAAKTYLQLIGVAPDDSPRWKAELAMTYRSAGKPAEAVAVYQQLVQEDPGNATRWLWETANTYRDSKQFKQAIGFYRQSDNFPENYKQMAGCHRRLKEYSEALILYNQIVGGDERSASWALLQMGYTHEEAGQKEPAIKTFQQVCKRYPKDSHASVAHAHLQTKYKISVTLGGAKDE